MKTEDLYHVLHCECCSKRIDILHDVLSYSDEAVAKALMVSEVAHIARVESRMREYLLSKWRLRAEQAAKKAGGVYKSTGSLKASFASVDKIMNKWDEEVALRFGKDIEEIYKLARNAGWKKANGQTSASLQYAMPNFTEELEGKVKKAKVKRRLAAVKPSFDLFDEQAVMQLQDDQMLWIGVHYDKNVRDTVRESVKPGVVQGVSRIEAGRRVSEAVLKQLTKVTVPGGFNGSDAKYFEGLAANTATNSRVRGQLRSFVDVGVTRYEIVNPMDNRTSPICVEMNGKVFTVREGASLISKVSGATNPEQVKEAHPWVSVGEARKIYKSGGERALAKKGLCLPPYHFRCRSTVDISTESVSFGSLSKEEMIEVPSRKQPTKQNTPKNRKPTSKPKKSQPMKRPATLPEIGEVLKAA